jgi:16S rRNA (guanine1516-N2)-methyltransferase
MSSGPPNERDNRSSRTGPEVTLAPPGTRADLARAAHFHVSIAATRDCTAWQIERDPGGLVLRAPLSLGGLRVSIDATSGPLARRLHSARPTDALPRAAGLSRGERRLRVVDATAGLCRDAMALAVLGCEVTAIERVPALCVLVAAAIEASGLGGLTLVGGDANLWLAACGPAERPDVVYLDPMFEEHGKAQVKKEMQVLRALCGGGDDEIRDARALLETALRTATRRVVVKRHHKAPPLVADPTFTIPGERVRFDVYATG